MRVVILAVALWALGLAAWAGDKPTMGPPDAWVRPSALPTPKDDAGGAYRLLLMDQQVNFTPDGDAMYVERAIRLQNTGALTAGGTVAIVWDPETDQVIVHKVQIRRGEQLIDVLAKQNFTVLRRETNLQRAALDGRLTATLQVEGLQIGDVLDTAYTIKRRDPAMKDRSNLIIAWPTSTADRAVIRALWSAPKTVQWKVSGGLEAPKLVRRGPQTELLLAHDGVQETRLPKGAPARFRQGPALELSNFTSWAEVGALMAPLYDKAATLKPDSPLRAEAAKIRAASPDPKAQAAMALALVEKQVRYLFLGMKDGGYVPADADVTWTRRFGDCKGKTVLLLALLRELHIEAEPSLVSTIAGDGLDARLPTMGLFDHVVVRATIDGKAYWLDGTRTEDRDLDSLKPPPFHWSLPQRPAGAMLVKLEPVALTEPEDSVVLRIDASAGILVPATLHAEATLRGEAGQTMHVAMSALPTADRDKALREAWERTFPKLKTTSLTSTYDEKSGVFRMIMDGAAPLEWETQPGYRFLRLSEANLGWKPDYKRDPGAFADAPFAVAYPAYSTYTVQLVLPNKGAGFVQPARM